MKTNKRQGRTPAPDFARAVTDGGDEFFDIDADDREALDDWFAKRAAEEDRWKSQAGDWHFINERVATGAAVYTREDLDVLIEDGITAVIDCRIEASYYDRRVKRVINPERKMVIDAGIAYLNMPMDDRGQRVPVTYYQKLIAFAMKALAKPGSKVLVHCAMGINRGPSGAYAILRTLGYSMTDAEQAIKQARPVTRNGLLYMEDADRAVLTLGYSGRVDRTLVPQRRFFPRGNCSQVSGQSARSFQCPPEARSVLADPK